MPVLAGLDVLVFVAGDPPRIRRRTDVFVLGERVPAALPRPRALPTRADSLVFTVEKLVVGRGVFPLGVDTPMLPDGLADDRVLADASLCARRGEQTPSYVNISSSEVAPSLSLSSKRCTHSSRCCTHSSPSAPSRPAPRARREITFLANMRRTPSAMHNCRAKRTHSVTRSAEPPKGLGNQAEPTTTPVASCQDL